LVGLKTQSFAMLRLIKHHIKKAKDGSGSGWVFFPCVDSTGSDMQSRVDIANNIDALIAEAEKLGSSCIAFNTNGYLKNAVLPQSNWSKFTEDNTKGLYVRHDYAEKHHLQH